MTSQMCQRFDEKVNEREVTGADSSMSDKDSEENCSSDDEKRGDAVLD
jgi:hypothetical protein